MTLPKEEGRGWPACQRVVRPTRGLPWTSVGSHRQECQGTAVSQCPPQLPGHRLRLAGGALPSSSAPKAVHPCFTPLLPRLRHRSRSTLALHRSCQPGAACAGAELLGNDCCHGDLKRIRLGVMTGALTVMEHEGGDTRGPRPPGRPHSRGGVRSFSLLSGCCTEVHVPAHAGSSN